MSFFLSGLLFPAYMFPRMPRLTPLCFPAYPQDVVFNVFRLSCFSFHNFSARFRICANCFRLIHLSGQDAGIFNSRDATTSLIDILFRDTNFV